MWCSRLQIDCPVPEAFGDQPGQNPFQRLAVLAGLQHGFGGGLAPIPPADVGQACADYAQVVGENYPGLDVAKQCGHLLYVAHVQLEGVF